jgi:hypothetical protein
MTFDPSKPESATNVKPTYPNQNQGQHPQPDTAAPFGRDANDNPKPRP